MANRHGKETCIPRVRRTDRRTDELESSFLFLESAKRRLQEEVERRAIKQRVPVAATVAVVVVVAGWRVRDGKLVVEEKFFLSFVVSAC